MTNIFMKIFESINWLRVIQIAGFIALFFIARGMINSAMPGGLPF